VTFLLSFYFVALGGHAEIVRFKRKKPKGRTLDKHFGQAHTQSMLQLSSNKVGMDGVPATLMDLRKGDAAILDKIDLPSDDARRLMELGFLPGARVTAGLSAPGGDPQVYQVDGSEIALRRETARKLSVRFEKRPRTK
jgi:Fe2+ transport system protein FeoA